MNNILIKKIDIDILVDNKYENIIKKDEYCIINFKKIKNKEIDITDNLINFMEYIINNENRIIIYGFLIYKNNILEARKDIKIDIDRLNNYILENQIYLKTYYSPNPAINLPRTYKKSHILNLRSRCYIIKSLQNIDTINLNYDKKSDIVTDDINYNFILDDINAYRIYKYTRLDDLSAKFISIITVDELLKFSINIEKELIKENMRLKDEILILKCDNINIKN